MTTVPPLDRSSDRRLAGFAATSGGAARLGITGAVASGAAAAKANAESGNANKALLNMILPDLRYVAAVKALTLPLTAVQMAADIGRHRRRHEFVDRPAVARDLLDELGRNRLQRHVGHQENGLDIVVELLVHARHLELIFEVRDRPQAAQDCGCALSLR